MTQNTYFIRLVLLLLMLSVSSVRAENTVVEVIQLRHSLLQDILPVVQPLIGPNGTATGMNDQLVVRATPTTITQIKQLLETLDAPPRRLMITVTQNIDGNLVENEHGISGRYRSGNVIVQSRDRQNRDGASVAIRDKNGNVLRYRTQSTTSDIDENNSYRVQTIAGQPAFIQQGVSVPIPNQQIYPTPNGLIIQDSVQYRDVTSGFYVLPRLSGDRVTLLVAPQLNRLRPYQNSGFDIQSVETTASGYLGEWIQIGGITEQYQERNSRFTASTSRQGQQARSIFIKVDEIF